MRREECAEEGGRPLAHPPLREVCEERLPVPEHGVEVERRLGRVEDGAQAGVRQERAELVLERGDDNGAEGGAVAGVLVRPERPHAAVSDSRDKRAAVVLAGSSRGTTPSVAPPPATPPFSARPFETGV